MQLIVWDRCVFGARVLRKGGKVEILEDTSASTRVVTDFVARARGIVVIIAIRIYNVDSGVDG